MPDAGGASTSAAAAAVNLREMERFVAQLSDADASVAAAAADALLDCPCPGAASGERGAPWAMALAEVGGIIPLLMLTQAVERGPDGLTPSEKAAGNTPEVVAAGDAALLVLAELAVGAAEIAR